MTRTRRLAAAYIALAAAVAVLFALNLFWGSVSLAPGAVLTALLGKGGDALAGNIILQLRLPRAVTQASERQSPKPARVTFQSTNGCHLEAGCRNNGSYNMPS